MFLHQPPGAASSFKYVRSVLALGFPARVMGYTLETSVEAGFGDIARNRDVERRIDQ
jgi:hypothetical protein